MHAARAVALAAVGALWASAAGAWADTRSSLSVDVRQIVRQVVPRDAIPALFLPKYDPASAAQYMRDGDRVIALDFAGEQLAYPTRILDHHEIVNDVVDGKPILLTY